MFVHNLTRRMAGWYQRVAHALMLMFARANRRPHLHFCFAAMGRISKSCGRVTPAHIEYTDAVIRRLSFSKRDRQQAIDWFREGRDEIADFHRLALACEAKPLPVVTEMVSECLVTIAEIEPCAAAQRTCKLLTSLLRIDNESLQATQQAVREDLNAIHDAKHCLELPTDGGLDSEQVQLAYRRLVARHHPDKLPLEATDEERANAAERTRALRAAYELLTR